MNNYEIRCTPEQTKKAFGFGAPIEIMPHFFSLPKETLDKYKFVDITNSYLKIPTAEQIIGWLEEQDVYINICWDISIYYVKIRSVNKGYLGIGDKVFSTRKEATLAAIDEALESLTNNKK